MKYLFMVSSIKFSKFNQFSFVPYILLLSIINPYICTG